jgi:hypothetical protein
MEWSFGYRVGMGEAITTFMFFVVVENGGN